ncbi:hypothetical protein M9458_020810, partial [Cirrhinus mrigala]
PQTLHEDPDDVVGFSHHPQRASPAPPQPRPPELFCLNDFLQASGSGRGSEDGLRRTVLSRCNYRKLLRLFLSQSDAELRGFAAAHTQDPSQTDH